MEKKFEVVVKKTFNNSVSEAAAAPLGNAEGHLKLRLETLNYFG